MPRPTAIPARRDADLYSTRALLVELLRHLDRTTNSGIIAALQGVAADSISPAADDVTVAPNHLRDSFDLLLQKARTSTRKV